MLIRDSGHLYYTVLPVASQQKLPWLLRKLAVSLCSERKNICAIERLGAMLNDPIYSSVSHCSPRGLATIRPLVRWYHAERSKSEMNWRGLWMFFPGLLGCAPQWSGSELAAAKLLQDTAHNELQGEGRKSYRNQNSTSKRLRSQANRHATRKK